MGGTGVIDNFLGIFTSYIDSGFGLLGGEVAFIATTLIVIDVTLAALFWAWGADDDILARLVKKTIFVGVFAYIIGNWNSLARIVFESFAGLGLMASGTGFSAADLLRPGRVAQIGLDAGRPLLESISSLMGWIAVFENLVQILCLFFAWALVILAFFILAIQLFVTLIEFKLTTLAGFVLIPFGLFGKTAFMAERVLGNVVSSGIKVLVLAVIIGIGSTLFSEFTSGFGGQNPSIDEAMAIVLAALSLLGLGIFGPGIATGLVSGGPQLSAGAAVGTGLAVGGAGIVPVEALAALDVAAQVVEVGDRVGAFPRALVEVLHGVGAVRAARDLHPISVDQRDGCHLVDTGMPCPRGEFVRNDPCRIVRRRPQDAGAAFREVRRGLRANLGRLIALLGDATTADGRHPRRHVLATRASARHQHDLAIASSCRIAWYACGGHTPLPIALS